MDIADIKISNSPNLPSPPFSLTFDRSYRKNLKKLKGLGFNLDLLSSKRHNLMVINRLKEDQNEELRSIIHKNFMVKKFRGNSLLQPIEQGDKDAMAEALKRHRL
jgi:hypothetical protein